MTYETNPVAFLNARKSIQLLVTCVIFKSEGMRHIMIAYQMLNMCTLFIRKYLDADQMSRLEQLAERCMESFRAVLERDEQHPSHYICVSTLIYGI